MILQTIQCKNTLRWGIAVYGELTPAFGMHITEAQAEATAKLQLPSVQVVTTEDAAHPVHQQPERKAA